MGKGSRTREGRIADRGFSADMFEQTKKKNYGRRRKTNKKKIAIIVAVLLAVVIAVVGTTVILVNNYKTSGAELRKTVSLKSDNYTIDNAKMTFYFKTTCLNYTKNYNKYLSQVGLDTTKSLKNQKCYYDQNKTWYEYFMDTTITQTKQMLQFLEAAKKDGFKLPDSAKKTLNTTLDGIKNTAKALSLSNDEYVAKTYGVGLNYEDVKTCLTWSTTATAYHDVYTKSLDYSEDDYGKYYAEHRDEIDHVDYISYTYNATYEDGADDAAKDAAKKEAKSNADKLAALKDVDSFKKAMRAVFKEANPDITEEKLTENVNNYMTTDKSKSDITSSSVASDAAAWLVSSERTAGETYVSDGDDYYTVYMIVKPAYRAEYSTKNVRHILFTADTYGSDSKAYSEAKQVLYQWKKDGKKVDDFVSLAAQYSEDPGSSSTGGLYENVKKGQMVEAFENWIYDESRKSGDSAIVHSDSGYHMMYFVGNGMIEWQAEADSELRSAAEDSYADKLAEEYKVTEYKTNAHKVDDMLS